MLVVELSAVDRLAAGTGAVGEVASLKHKLDIKYTKIAKERTKRHRTSLR